MLFAGNMPFGYMSVNRALLSGFNSVLSEYSALFSVGSPLDTQGLIHRALLNVYRALLIHRPLLDVYRALLSVYRPQI